MPYIDKDGLAAPVPNRGNSTKRGVLYVWKRVELILTVVVICISVGGIIQIFYNKNLDNQNLINNFENKLDNKLLCLCHRSQAERTETSCEGKGDIRFERNMNTDSPHYCITVINIDVKYKLLVIEYDGEKEFRDNDKYYANEVESDAKYKDLFSLQNGIVEIVIFPTKSVKGPPETANYRLQRILKITLDNKKIICDLTPGHDCSFPNQLPPSDNYFVNSCIDRLSRTNGEHNKCSILDGVIVEELQFNHNSSYYCVGIDKSLRSVGRYESNITDVEISMNNARPLFPPKRNIKCFRAPTNDLRYSFIQRNETIALLPTNDAITISAIKVNGDESCKGFELKPKVCGQKKVKEQFLIYSGQSTFPGEFPWHIGIFEFNHQDLSTVYKCGGTIIGKDTIVTAAHCLDRDHGKIIESRLRVHAGFNDLALNNQNRKEYLVEQYHLHPKWNKVGRDNDIAIIKLQSYLEFSDYIQPVCITPDKGKFIDKVGVLPGWGINEKNERPNILYRASFPIIRNINCRSSNRNVYESLVNESTFCGGYTNGTTACTGDSGGGLVFHLEDGWYVRGIVSMSPRIVDHQLGLICNIAAYVVFTDVSEHYEWIVSHSKVMG